MHAVIYNVTFPMYLKTHLTLSQSYNVFETAVAISMKKQKKYFIEISCKRVYLYLA